MRAGCVAAGRRMIADFRWKSHVDSHCRLWHCWAQRQGLSMICVTDPRDPPDRESFRHFHATTRRAHVMSAAIHGRDSNGCGVLFREPTQDRGGRTGVRKHRSYRRIEPRVTNLNCFVASLPRITGLGAFQVAQPPRTTLPSRHSPERSNSVGLSVGFGVSGDRVILSPQKNGRQEAIITSTLRPGGSHANFSSSLHRRLQGTGYRPGGVQLIRPEWPGRWTCRSRHCATGWRPRALVSR
jgi:hypothetical protein